MSAARDGDSGKTPCPPWPQLVRVRHHLTDYKEELSTWAASNKCGAALMDVVVSVAD